MNLIRDRTHIHDSLKLYDSRIHYIFCERHGDRELLSKYRRCTVVDDSLEDV